MKEKILEILYETTDHVDSVFTLDEIAQKIADGLGAATTGSETGKPQLVDGACEPVSEGRMAKRGGING